MIIVNLKGGLGNQMFQYAMGRKLSLANKVDLKLDKTGYDRGHFRSYGLGIFNIKENFASEEEIRKIKYPYGLLSKAWRGFVAKILRQHHTSWEPNSIKKIEKKISQNKDVYLDGYWQSYKYFENIKDILSKDFSLKIPLEETHPELLSKIASTNSVAVSFRRTDYLLPQNLKTIGICSAKYYNQAVELMAAKIDDPIFFVISDDLDWVKDSINFKNCPVVYVSEMRKDNSINYFQEMMIMSKCKHGIIANSSFSWLPTWLNPNKEKIIIAPDIWFTNNSIKTDDIIPPAWIKLPRD
jgi:hypothetical protein